MTKHDDPQQPNDGELTDDAARARRRLLKIGAYVVPVVVGTLLYSGDAKAQTGPGPSCGPATCTPPRGDSACGPPGQN